MMTEQWIAEEQARYNRINGILSVTQAEYIDSITSIEGDDKAAAAVHISIGCTSYDSHVAWGMDSWKDFKYISPTQEDIYKVIHQNIEYPSHVCIPDENEDTYGYGYKVYITCVSREEVEQEIAKLQALL